jgi:hypothetical protein
MLSFIKLIHTLIWLCFNAIIAYLYYAAIVGDIDKWVWIGISLIVLEGIVLLIFKKSCPITIIARKYTNSTKANVDIYLPEWLARNNKLIYSILFVIVLVILFLKLILVN